MAGDKVTFLGHLSLGVWIRHVNSGADGVILDASVGLGSGLTRGYRARLRSTCHKLGFVRNVLGPFFLTFFTEEFQGGYVGARPRILHIRGLFEYAASRGCGTKTLNFGRKAVALSFLLLVANSLGSVRSRPRVQILLLTPLFDLVERRDTKPD